MMPMIISIADDTCNAVFLEVELEDLKDIFNRISTVSQIYQKRRTGYNSAVSVDIPSQFVVKPTRKQKSGLEEDFMVPQMDERN